MLFSSREKVLHLSCAVIQSESRGVPAFTHSFKSPIFDKDYLLNAATHPPVISVGKRDLQKAPPEKFTYLQTSGNSFIHGSLGPLLKLFHVEACIPPNPRPTWPSLQRSLPELPTSESPGMLVYSKTIDINLGTGAVQR